MEVEPTKIQRREHVLGMSKVSDYDTGNSIGRWRRQEVGVGAMRMMDVGVEDLMLYALLLYEKNCLCDWIKLESRCSAVSVVYVYLIGITIYALML